MIRTPTRGASATVNIIKRCNACARDYFPHEWSAARIIGWQGAGEGPHAIEMRACTACTNTMAIEITLADLEKRVDDLGARVTYRALPDGGWHAAVSGLALPAHIGLGPTGAAALAEVLTFARRIGAIT